MEKRHTISEFTDLLAENGLISEMSIGSSGEKTIEYISFSSADMRNNTLFVCKGKHFEEKYLADALARGAVIYVSEKKYEARRWRSVHHRERYEAGNGADSQSFLQ